MFSARVALSGTGGAEISAERRAEVISRALAVCDGVREVYGNCVITVLTFSGGREFGFFDVYANKAEHDMESVGETVEGVAAKVIGENL